jgi:hypothetical protein
VISCTTIEKQHFFLVVSFLRSSLEISRLRRRNTVLLELLWEQWIVRRHVTGW